MATPTTDSIRVIWRTWRDGARETFAIFPDLPWSTRDDCTTYQHVGQHGGGDYVTCLARSRPATEAAIAPLRAELTQAPYYYQLRTVRRRGRRHALRG